MNNTQVNGKGGGGRGIDVLLENQLEDRKSTSNCILFAVNNCSYIDKCTPGQMIILTLCLSSYEHCTFCFKYNYEVWTFFFCINTKINSKVDNELLPCVHSYFVSLYMNSFCIISVFVVNCSLIEKPLGNYCHPQRCCWNADFLYPWAPRVSDCCFVGWQLPCVLCQRKQLLWNQHTRWQYGKQHTMLAKYKWLYCFCV